MSSSFVTDINGTFFSSSNATCNRAGLNLERQPDPDIAGIGVVLAFFIPAYTSLVFVIVAYAAGLVNDELLTTADRYFYGAKDRVLLKGTRRWSRWAEGLEKGVLSFSDTQLVFGIAMLITGFVQIESISIYHIQTVTYLAWMSSNVHLTTLTVLREYFMQNRVLRFGRIAGMVVLAVLLTVALIPTGSSKAKQILLGNLRKPGGSYGFNAPARCFFTANQGLAGPTDPDAPWSFIILAASYIWKIGTLFGPSRNAFSHYIRAAPLGLLEKALHRSLQTRPSNAKQRRPGFLRRLGYGLLLMIFMMLLMVFDLGASFAGSLYFLTLTLSWGTVQVLIPRSAFNSSMNYDSEENSWSFGQILPLLLLALPIFTIVEHFYGHTEEDKDTGIKLRTPKYELDYYLSLDKEIGKEHTSSDHIKAKAITTVTQTSVKSDSSLLSPPPMTPLSPGDTNGADEATVALIAPSPPPVPLNNAAASSLDEKSAIYEFFAKGNLTRDERTSLHISIYHSRVFRIGMFLLNLGTSAVIVELVAHVLSGEASGDLWMRALILVGGTAAAILLALGVGGVVGSRLFRIGARSP